jgi:hypothetical protein
MAKSQGLDEASLADIHRRYGDHLYAKDDFDGAMQQYLQTLGNLQPSYVIRKVLSGPSFRLMVLTFVQVP